MADVAKQRLIETTKFSAQNKSFTRIAWRFGLFLIKISLVRQKNRWFFLFLAKIL